MNAKKIELLAPAGSMEALIAAVSGGCDAVYLGGINFSARAFANNFDHQQLEEAINYCHLRDVKVYVTMNTLVFESEFNNVVKEVDYLYNVGVDALLIQDLGLFHYVRTCYPDFEVHCSTQMHIHNEDGVEMMSKLGASRVVLARETPIDIVRKCCQKDIEIEVFVYGAICVSYSGQCLMSSSIMNRSGNRGMCSQMCRLPYYPTQNGKKGNKSYVLSPRDLNLLEKVPELIEAGVSSLKIEGRMKNSEYVYYVTSLFRKAIDAYYDNKSFSVTNEQIKTLKILFNRQFSLGHIFNSSTKDRLNTYRPNHLGVKVGQVIDVDKDRVKIKLTDTINQHDGLRIISDPEDIGLTAVIIENKGKYVNKAEKNDEVWLKYKHKNKPRIGDSINLTKSSKVNDDIAKLINLNDKKIPVTITYSLESNKPVLLHFSDGKNDIELQSEEICQKAKNKPLDLEKIHGAFSKLGASVYVVDSISGKYEECFVSMTTLNQLRQEAIKQLDSKRLAINRNGKLPYTFKPHKTETYRAVIRQEGNKCIREVDSGLIEYTNLPVIRENNLINSHDNVVINEVGEFNYEYKNSIVGMTLNCTNSYAVAFLLSLKNSEGVILSSEIDNNMIKLLVDSYVERYGYKPMLYQLVSGRRNLMYIKNGIIDNADTLVDMYGNKYEIKEYDEYICLIDPKNFTNENLYCDGSYIIVY